MMADEQPNIPLEGAQAPDATTSESVSDESRTEPSQSWWSKLFHRPQEATAEDGEQSSTDAPSEAKKPTQEELERRVQSEVDRREAQRIAREKAEQKRKLRDEDPWAYAQQEREAEKNAEQNTSVQTFFQNVGVQHDRIAIDPLMEALPVSERDRIMKIEGAGRGLEGRKLVVDEALKSLARHWKAQGEKEAEAKLRRNSAFRKQVLAEHRGDFQEPELLPAFSGSSTDRKVSEILRGYYGLPGGPRHNGAS